MNNRERILRYLQSIHPIEATISEIESATGVSPHAQVYQKTQELLKSGKITGWQVGRTWHFKATSGLGNDQMHSTSPLIFNRKQPQNKYAQFEINARKAFTRKFGVLLKSGTAGDVPKKWDMVSKDGEIVGDAKYYTLVGGTRLPPAKFSTIAEHVWLLEKTGAKVKFLVFGNQIEVPKLWLEKYGKLVKDVKLYFLENSGKITLLN